MIQFFTQLSWSAIWRGVAISTAAATLARIATAADSSLPVWLGIAVTLAIGLGTLFFAAIGVRLTRRRDTTSEQAQIAISATALAEQLQIRLEAVQTEAKADSDLKERRISALEIEMRTMSAKYSSLEDQYQMAVKQNIVNEQRIQRQDEAIRLLLSILDRLTVILRERGLLDAQLSSLLDPVQAWRVLSGLGGMTQVPPLGPDPQQTPPAP